MKQGFTSQDIEQIESHGMTVEEVARQLDFFRRGFAPVQIVRPCTVGDGIQQIGEDRSASFLENHDRAEAEGRVTKFIPASGAASRMFKELETLLEWEGEMTFEMLCQSAQKGQEEAVSAVQFISNLRKFAFYDNLAEHAVKANIELDRILVTGDVKPILQLLLTPAGLNYSQLPKGLIPFHRYPNGVRCPFEEHIAEAVQITRDHANRVRTHFTIAEDYRQIITERIEQFGQMLPGVQLEIDYSVQQESTDTIAADIKGQPFRDSQGRLVFRPGGHGALIGNLSASGGDIAIMKNIDNVAPESRSEPGNRYQKLICGLLVEVQDKCREYIQLLQSGQIDKPHLEEIERFVQDVLHCGSSTVSPPTDRAAFLLEKLNRPIRVCGMVLNTGEPGGGPFWIRESDGSLSLQIVETAQISDAEDQQTILQASTHFNPVFIACGLKDYRGKPFDLHNFVDPETGFISVKSYEGRPLKALELPGLWNGAMAKWNTIFVEVPLEVLNPVKTVIDLLREVHLA